MLGARALAILSLAAGCRDRPAAKEEPEAAHVTVTGCAVALRPTGDVVVDPWVAPGEDVGPAAPPEPKIRFETPSIQGSLPKERLMRALKKQTKRFEQCYAAVIRSRPAVTGTLTAQFTIGPAATVIAGSADGLDDELGRCVVRALRAIELPETKRGGSTVVRLPITFRMESSAAIEPGPDAGPAPPPSPLASLTWADEGGADGFVAWMPGATASVRAAIDAARCRLDELTGSLRARLGIGPDGKVAAAEVHGLGDAAAEDCVRDRLAALVVTAPPSPVAIACDVVAGAAAPWRITVRPDHVVIDADAPGDVAALRAASPDAIFVVRATDATPTPALRAVIAALERPRARYRVAVAKVLVSDMIPRGAGPSSTTPELVELTGATGAELRAAAAKAHAAGLDRIVIAP